MKVCMSFISFSPCFPWGLQFIHVILLLVIISSLILQELVLQDLILRFSSGDLLQFHHLHKAFCCILKGFWDILNLLQHGDTKKITSYAMRNTHADLREVESIRRARATHRIPLTLI